MTSITARLARIDLARDFERHGNGGDPAVAHAFNALSFLFPHAQRIFIDVARAVVWDLGQANARGMKMCSQQKTGGDAPKVSKNRIAKIDSEARTVGPIAHMAWVSLAASLSVLLIFAGGGHPPPIILLPPVLAVWVVGHPTQTGSKTHVRLSEFQHGSFSQNFE